MLHIPFYRLTTWQRQQKEVPDVIRVMGHLNYSVTGSKDLINGAYAGVNHLMSIFIIFLSNSSYNHAVGKTWVAVFYCFEILKIFSNQINAFLYEQIQIEYSLMVWCERYLWAMSMNIGQDHLELSPGFYDLLIKKNLLKFN